MSKTAQFSYEALVEFFAVSLLEGVHIKTPAGEMKGTIVFIPDDAMKELKPKIVPEGEPNAGEIIPSKGHRAAVGSKTGDNWGPAFIGDVGLQLTYIKLNEVKKRENIF
jgi:hypothetical protein